ncbi:MAG: helix-turn-helix transcriptional regulator [Alphaproteobacteria bacterium]|nr:helix-turn-helix transcriptional regulator [Alphaproteobacteria bacterium]
MAQILRKIVERLYYKNISLTRNLGNKKSDITVDQLKAARALLGWSQADLAKKSGYSLPAVNNIERGLYKAHDATMEDIVQTFEQNGIQFLDGPGVRLENSGLRIKCYEGRDAFHYLFAKIEASLKDNNQELLICGIDEKLIKDVYGKELSKLQKSLKDNPVRIITYKDFSYAMTFNHFQKRVVDDAKPLLPCFIYAGRVAIVLMENPIHIAILYNEKIAQDYAKYFDFLWKQSR